MSTPVDVRENPELAFDEPWQVEAFAIVVSLTRRGVFGWEEWARTFGRIIRAEPQRPEETVTAAYYRQWTAALESLTASSVGLEGNLVEERLELWRDAYLGTPHGRPVQLENHVNCALPRPEPGTHHDHDHPRLSRSELAARARPTHVDPARNR